MVLAYRQTEDPPSPLLHHTPIPPSHSSFEAEESLVKTARGVELEVLDRQGQCCSHPPPPRAREPGLSPWIKPSESLGTQEDYRAVRRHYSCYYGALSSGALPRPVRSILSRGREGERWWFYFINSFRACGSGVSELQRNKSNNPQNKGAQRKAFLD